MRTDVYERITGQIVAELEKGVRPWLKPWNAEHAAGRITRPLRHNGMPYQGINVVMLWSAAVAQGFAAPIWMTFKQAQQLGAHVRKGEKGNLVVYASTVTRTETDEETGEEQERDIPFMKGYTVFNVEQIDGVPTQFYAPAEPRLDPVQRIDHAEAFFAATGAEIRQGGSQAYYAVHPDYVQMPPFKTFRDAESYYATLAHECTHWTGHASRFARDLSGAFGSKAYAREELVAEMASAFVCASLSITPTVRHTDYVGSWLDVLREDNRAIFRAASLASKAADYLLACRETEAGTGEAVA